MCQSMFITFSTATLLMDTKYSPWSLHLDIKYTEAQTMSHVMTILLLIKKYLVEAIIEMNVYFK